MSINQAASYAAGSLVGSFTFRRYHGLLELQSKGEVLAYSVFRCALASSFAGGVARFAHYCSPSLAFSAVTQIAIGGIFYKLRNPQNLPYQETKTWEYSIRSLAFECSLPMVVRGAVIICAIGLESLGIRFMPVGESNKIISQMLLASVVSLIVHFSLNANNVVKFNGLNPDFNIIDVDKLKK